MKKIGIYVHIPFCIKKCKYCDFTSFENCEEKVEKYINALLKTIENSEIFLQNNDDILVDTIYIGGGTPSFISSDYIVLILNKIKQKFKLINFPEITIEVNPGTVDKSKLQTYFDCGINRLSIGLQSTQNKILNLIGRVHTYEQFLETYSIAEEVGFKNINVDLMLALPHQTLEMLEDSVNEVIKLNPNHISLYSLILEENTPLEKEIHSGLLKLPSDELERKMYHSTKHILEKNGYLHYEISNFAKKSFESKHNLNCWNQNEYLGFGLASHSYINNVRFSNIDDLNEYIKNIENNEFQKNVIIHEVQNKEAQMKEYMMLGFRKLEGISISKFEQKFNIHPLFYFRFEIEKLEKLGLICVDLDKIFLTKKGLDLANQVFEEFI